MKNFARVLGVAFLLFFAVAAVAQITTGSLGGSVTDPTGRAIPGATLTLTDEVSGAVRSSKTNELGDFLFPGLSASIYTLRVEATGFRALDRKGNVVLSNARTALGAVQLEMGSLTESVEVTAQGAEVATTTTDHSSVVDAKEMALIQVRGRDVVTMLRIIPGVSQGTESDILGGAFSTVVPTLQGKGGNVVRVDGVNGGDSGGGGRFAGATNLDAIDEVSVQMSNYAAEYGKQGGSEVNFITKHGGRQFHGSAYWYKRHEMWNATNFFNNLNGIKKQVYRYQNLGGTVGGPVPVHIPILNPNGQRMNFFYSFDDTQAKDPSISPTAGESGGVAQTVERWTMPTALERQGNFSQSFDLNGKLIIVKDPLTGSPFPNNIVPADRASKYGVAIMNILPLPNYNGAGENFVTQWGALAKPRRQHLYRFDLRPTDKDTISIKHQTWYTLCTGVMCAINSSSWGLDEQKYDFTADMANVNYTRIISPSMVYEAGIGIFYSTEIGPPADETNLEKMQRQFRGLGGLPQFAPRNNPLNVIPMATFGGIPTSYVAASINYDGRWPATGADTSMPINNTLTYIHGSHTFKAGVQRTYERFAQARKGTFAGSFDFSNDPNDPANTGYAFANAFVGHVTSYTENLGRVPDNRRQYIWAWFAQDTWKVSHRLTLDIGLRVYKWAPPLQGGTNNHGEASEFSFERYDPTWGGKPPVLYAPVMTPQGRQGQNPLTGQLVPTTFIGQMVPGTGYSCTAAITPATPCVFNGMVIQDDPTFTDIGHGFVDNPGLQYDPRFGLAWDVFGDGKTAIRTAFGTFHNSDWGGSNSGGANIYGASGPAYTFSKQVLYTDMDSFINSSLTTNPISVSGTRRTNPKLNLFYQYNFGIQRELGWHTVLDAAYVGSTQHNIYLSWNYNMLPRGVRFLPQSRDTTTASSPLPDAFLRPIIGWGDINIQVPAATARYDSLQAQVNRRFAAGFELAAAYTYASGSSWGWYQQMNPIMNHPRNPLIQTHVLSITYVKDLPAVSKLIKVPVSKWALDNWQFSGITTFASGFPQNVSLTTADNFDFTGGGESCGIDQTGSALLPWGDRTRLQWFNTSVFKRPAGRGDLGNNCQTYKIRGPGFNNWDATLFKTFPIREGKTLQLRWEVYNLFNHTQFKTINSTARFDTAGNQTNTAFGTATDARPERRMQASLRFIF